MARSEWKIVSESDGIQANTMLLYPLQEAIDLLTNKLLAAKKSLEDTAEDLEWLREQVTVMEVNFARVHNVGLGSIPHWSVTDHRLSCASGTSSGEADDPVPWNGLISLRRREKGQTADSSGDLRQDRSPRVDDDMD